MTIRIAQKIRPFTHLPGEKIPIPGTAWALAAYPARLCFYDLSEANPSVQLDIRLDIAGPVDEFTSQLDPAKGMIKVWGKSQKGFYRIHIHGSDAGVGVYFDKTPEQGLSFRVENEPDHIVHAKEWYVSTTTGSFAPYVSPKLERLSLGSHKSQDWEGVKRRSDLAEILPVWYQLGQVFSDRPIKGEEGALSLLSGCLDYKGFYRLFLAGFEGMMCPRLFDSDYQGLALPPITNEDQSPFPLLTQGWRFIRNLFFLERKEALEFLPNLPVQFHAGRLVAIKTADGLTIDLEWTKKKLRRLAIRADGDVEKDFIFPKEFKSFRLKSNKSDKGRRIRCGEPLLFKNGTISYLDNFTK